MTYELSALFQKPEQYFDALFEALPGNSVLVQNDAPKFTILAVTPAYLKQTGYTKEAMIGKGVFEAFPTNSTDANDTGGNDLLLSYQHVVLHKEPHFLPVQRYDLQNGDGSFTEKYWRISNKPVFAPDGNVVYIIHTSEDITEKTKAAQREIQIEGIEKAYRLFMQAPAVIAVVSGEDHVLQLANAGAFKLWGKGPEIIGKPLLKAIPEVESQGIVELLDKVRTTGTPYMASAVPVHTYRDGKREVQYFDLIYQPYHEGNSSMPTGVFTISHNVTELVEARQKIEESEAALKQFKFMADHAQDPFILMRKDGTFAYLNRKALDAWGYTAEEAQYIRVPDVDPIYQDEAYKQLFKKAQKEIIPQFQTLHKRKDGRTYPVEINVNGLTIDGEPHLFAVARDVTERKKTELALESQTELIRTIANNTTSTLFMMDDHGYCTFINATGERMFGYTLEELKEKPMHDMIHHHKPDGSPYPRNECPLENALHKKQAVQAHRELFFRKDGSSFVASCAASPVFENGNLVSAVIEVRDITIEVEAEETLRRSAQELEQMVQERTRELKQSNEQLKQFTYAASHDLQEPLRKISFFLDLLLSGISQHLNEENKRVAARIMHTTERMRNLINDLLAYSNTSLGVTGFQEVNLTTILKDVLDDMEATIVEKEASITLDHLPVVEGDARQLRQLFHNLIGNALKYHRKNEAPQVLISARLVQGKDTDMIMSQEKRNATFHEIQVKDNGIGFDQDDAERIFGLFQRLHGKAEYEGTGVGLAIAQKVVENHAGYIWAESVPGAGATFKVLLPAQKK